MRHRLFLGLVLAAVVGALTGVGAGAPQSPDRNVAPRFWRDAKLNVRWTGAASNLTFISNFIAEGMRRRLGEGTVYTLYGETGSSTWANVISVGDDEADFGVTTPSATAKLALNGKGYFPKAYPDLRAIAVFPQNDWVMCVVNPSLGVSSYDDIKAKHVPVKIATNRIGARNGISFLVEQILNAHGITVKDIQAWGGGFVEVEGAPEAAQAVLDGKATMACHEYWKAFFRLTDKMPVTVLPVTEAAMDRLVREFGYQRNTIPKDTFGPGVPARDTLAVDYSDWVVIANAKVPEDLAYLAAKVAVEDRVRGFDELYLHQPLRTRSADVPVKPEVMWKNVGVPLHPGAARYYREKKLMPEQEKAEARR